MSVEIEVRLLDGWHVTAPGEAGERYVPIEVALDATESHWALAHCEYPEPTESLQVDQAEPVPIFEDRFSVALTLKPKTESGDLLSASMALCVNRQLCNDSNCLLPQTVKLRL